MNRTKIRKGTLGAGAGIALLAILAGGCGEEDTPVGTGGGATCERNGTATIEFANNSDRSTYEVIMDGARVATIGPDQSTTQVVAAGQHTIRFVFANTNNSACTEASPIFAQCSNMVMSCSSDL